MNKMTAKEASILKYDPDVIRTKNLGQQKITYQVNCNYNDKHVTRGIE